MPVPRRRKQPLTPSSLFMQLPSMAMKMLDVDFVFQKTRVALFYAFAPAVIWIGMNTEPTPSGGFWEIINLLE